jgi:hypothetical protein
MSSQTLNGQAPPTNRREQVRTGRTPRDDRYVTLTTQRILATNCYVVAIVDGTGRLVDPQTLLTTPSFDKARRHANALFDSWGGGGCESNQPTPTAEFLPRTVRRPYDYPDGRRTFHAVGTVTELHEPARRTTTGKGRWYVRWYYAESRNNQPRTRTFPTEQEAIAFHTELSQLMRRT